MPLLAPVISRTGSSGGAGIAEASRLRTIEDVDPSRKRKIRLVVALSAAVLLAVALIYTSFSASTEAKEPSQIILAGSGSTYEMTGKVVRGSVKQNGKEGISFLVTDRGGNGEK